MGPCRRNVLGCACLALLQAALAQEVLLPTSELVAEIMQHDAAQDPLTRTQMLSIRPHVAIIDSLAIRPKDFAANLRDSELTLVAVQRWGPASQSGEVMAVLDNTHQRCWEHGLHCVAIHFRVSLDKTSPLLPAVLDKTSSAQEVAFIWIRGGVIGKPVWSDATGTEQVEQLLQTQIFAGPTTKKSSSCSVSEFVLHFLKAMMHAAVEQESGGWYQGESVHSKCTVDRRVSSSISVSEFSDRYLGAKPVMIVGNEKGRHAKMRAALAVDPLLEKYGRYSLSTGDPRLIAAGANGAEQVMSDYVGYLNQPAVDEQPADIRDVAFDNGNFLSKAGKLSQMSTPIRYLADLVSAGRADLFEAVREAMPPPSLPPTIRTALACRRACPPAPSCPPPRRRPTLPPFSLACRARTNSISPGTPAPGPGPNSTTERSNGHCTTAVGPMSREGLRPNGHTPSGSVEYTRTCLPRPALPPACSGRETCSTSRMGGGTP